MNKIIIFLLLALVSSLSLSFGAVDLTKYEYVSKINVDCNEYKGYIKVKLPQEYLNLDNPKTYFEIEKYFINTGYEITNYLPQNYWYVKTRSGENILDIENIYDKNQNTYMLFENQEATFIFANPQITQIDKIIIPAKDSQINNIRLYTSLGEEIEYIKYQDNFNYELYFTKSYILDEIYFKLYFDNILKLSEISFYKKEEKNEETFLYFYLDNNCGKDFKFYFGNFGEDDKRFPKNVNIPIVSPLSIETNKNTLYNNDFDNDTILNQNDNCIYIANLDQKDINYNKLGDACEDSDSDSIVDANDNCVDKYNRDQLDNDKDGIGNVCDFQEDRFFEKNIILVYIFAGLIGILFIALSIKIVQKENQKN